MKTTIKWISALCITVNCIADSGAPAWSREAVWYQIFPERFANGDPTNDPVRESLFGTWPYVVPEDWSVSPWPQDWYEQQPWEKNTGKDFYYTAQLRRFGGDIQGIINELDYLQDLGVNALYLNPVFNSASLHKYGASHFHHIDRHFGPDPEGDKALFATENPADPSTWKWSAADQLFLSLIKEVHRRDMRIIIDGVFNHVGIPFWAFQHAIENGPEGPYASWFHIDQWDDPATDENELVYHGWVGVQDLPELRKDENGPVDEVQKHIKAVVERWMDPNGDGDPSDGVDGWRLDVAAEVPLPFWKTFRTWVKSIRPDAFTTGEIWWQDYQNHGYANAAPWLEGDAFDAVMNYRFGDLVYQFMNQSNAPLDANTFAMEWNRIKTDYDYPTMLSLQNLMGSHDTSRIGSAIVNPDARQDHDANLQHHPRYLVRAPNEEEQNVQRLMVAYQMFAPGAPFVYYGDEAGMWGADDPDCRKPMVWPEARHDDEKAHPLGLQRTTDKVTFNHDLHAFYKQAIHMRRNEPCLNQGSFEFLTAGENQRWMACLRQHGDGVIVGIFNAQPEPCIVDLKHLGVHNTNDVWDCLLGVAPENSQVRIPAKSFTILKRTAR